MFQYAIQYTGEAWERQNIERQLMDLYRRQGKLEGMLQQAESEGMLSFEMQRQRARDHASQGEWEQAANAYKKAMDMTTQSWERNEVSTELVRIYAQLGQIDTAIDLYKTLSRAGLSGMSINWGGSTVVQIYFAGDKARESLINTYRNQGKLDDLLTYFETQGLETVENPTRLEITAEAIKPLPKLNPGTFAVFTTQLQLSIRMANRNWHKRCWMREKLPYPPTCSGIRIHGV